MEAIQVTDYPVNIAVSSWDGYDEKRVWISMSIDGAGVYKHISTAKAKELIAALTAVVEENEKAVA